MYSTCSGLLFLCHSTTLFFLSMSSYHRTESQCLYFYPGLRGRLLESRGVRSCYIRPRGKTLSIRTLFSGATGQIQPVDVGFFSKNLLMKRFHSQVIVCDLPFDLQKGYLKENGYVIKTLKSCGWYTESCAILTLKRWLLMRGSKLVIRVVSWSL